MNRIQGRVRWFDDEKGFGFLTQPPDGNDVYCHFSEIQVEPGAPQTLTEGQLVEYGMAQGPKGIQAVNIVPLS